MINLEEAKPSAAFAEAASGREILPRSGRGERVEGCLLLLFFAA